MTKTARRGAPRPDTAITIAVVRDLLIRVEAQLPWCHVGSASRRSAGEMGAPCGQFGQLVRLGMHPEFRVVPILLAAHTSRPVACSGGGDLDDTCTYRRDLADHDRVLPPVAFRVQQSQINYQ